ncbi:MAG TPA: hypothetical protein ENN41_11085 [Sediminispirochaeta sp.]|nr:hypothetical protein [Sediminispirochaeta sp.]
MFEPAFGLLRPGQIGLRSLRLEHGSKISFHVLKKINSRTWLISLQGRRLQVESRTELQVGGRFQATVLRQSGRMVLKIREQAMDVAKIINRLSLPVNDGSKILIETIMRQGLPLHEDSVRRLNDLFRALPVQTRQSAAVLILLHDKGMLPTVSQFSRLLYLLDGPTPEKQARRASKKGAGRDDPSTAARGDGARDGRSVLRVLRERIKAAGTGDELLQLFNHLKAKHNNWIVVPFKFPADEHGPSEGEGRLRLHSDLNRRIDKFTLSFYGARDFHFTGVLQGETRRISLSLEHRPPMERQRRIISLLREKLGNLGFEIDDTIKEARNFAPFPGEDLPRVQKIDKIV